MASAAEAGTRAWKSYCYFTQTSGVLEPGTGTDNQYWFWYRFFPTTVKFLPAVAIKTLTFYK